MKQTFEIIAGLFVLVFMGTVLWQMTHQVPASPEPIACTLEAKLCSDGSAVGRVGPDCEFASCPGEDLTARTAGFKFAIEEQVRIEIGQPIEGYEPAMFMQVLPGLEPQDFNGAEAQIGFYQYSEGELRHELGDDEIVHSAAPALTEAGIETLLDNVITRLELEAETTTVEDVITELKNPDMNPEEPVACTADAKECSDGSYVGRVAPNCAFAKCPAEGGPVSNCTVDTMQCPDGSWVNRTAPHCEFEACPASEFPIRYGEDTSRMEEYRSDCEQRNGVFNECSSPCDDSTDPNLSCATVCSMVCEGPASEHVPPVAPPSPNEPVACTMDAKQCPDGSYVGRQGPDCEFAECPTNEKIWYGEDVSKMEEYRLDCDNKGGEFDECASPCDDAKDEDLSCATVCSMMCTL